MHSRDAFGRLIIDPDQLALPERVDVLRRLAGQLQAADGLESRWIGRKLGEWLRSGGDLCELMGLRPKRGSRATAQRLIRTEQRDHLMLRLSVACGGDRAALRLLKDECPCPDDAAGVLGELRRIGAPNSVAAFHRARARVSQVR